MSIQILKKITKILDEGQSLALVTLTETSGSTPRKSGSIMAVLKNGETIGTIGGGKIEYTVINRVLEGFANVENFEFSYNLNPDGELKMICGGKVKGYVNYFQSNPKLLIFGGGHIAQKLSVLAETIPFDTYVTDPRSEYEKNFHTIKKYVCTDYKDAIMSLDIDDNTFIVITTHSHISDIEVLREVIHLPAKYIGMVGSNRKVLTVKEEFLKEGFTQEILDKVYTPIGLKIANNTPEEIAFSIMGEILGVKNGLITKNQPSLKNENN